LLSTVIIIGRPVHITEKSSDHFDQSSGATILQSTYSTCLWIRAK